MYRNTPISRMSNLKLEEIGRRRASFNQNSQVKGKMCKTFFDL
jgi:hypothetical protein